MYSLKRRVAYYETDAMAIVHHSNHLRFFEEARVGWFRECGMGQITWDVSQDGNAMYFPLIESSVKYIKPLRFDDEVETRLQVRREGTRFYFQYAIYLLDEGMDKRSQKFSRKKVGSNSDEPVLLATGTTTHVLVDENFKVAKMVNPKVTEIMEKESWTEIWP